MERLAALTMTLLMVAVSITSSLNVRNPPYEGQKYLIITIDTEAQSSRQSHDHVQRLIYGNFSEGRAGILEMMDEAENVGVQLTFFVDVLEDTLYPGEIREVLRTIHARGHDIQLHQHAYLIPDETWNEWKNEPHWHHHEADPLHKIDCWDKETADFVFEQMISVLKEENIPPPVASRGGSYAYNQAILNSMAKHNITTSYNYEPQLRTDYFNEGTQPMFKWSNGIVEVPVTYIPVPWTLSGLDRLDDTLWSSWFLDRHFDSFFDASNGDTVAVMIFHSWSFLERVEHDDGEFFEYSNDKKVKQFSKFLENIPDDVEVITATELAGKISAGEFEITTEYDVAEASNHCTNPQ